LHGSISLEDDEHEVRIISVGEETSQLLIAPQEAEQFGPESEKVEARDTKWMEYIESQQNTRRSLNEDLESGSVDVHIHLDIDGPMKRKYGTLDST